MQIANSYYNFPIIDYPIIIITHEKNKIMVWFQVIFHLVISDRSITYSPKIWRYCFDNEKNVSSTNCYITIIILKKSSSRNCAIISHWNLGWSFSQIKSVNIKWSCGCRNPSKSRTSPKTKKIRTIFCLRRDHWWLRQTSRQMRSLTDICYVYRSLKLLFKTNPLWGSTQNKPSMRGHWPVDVVKLDNLYLKEDTW